MFTVIKHWFQELEDTSISLMKKELGRFKKLLNPDYPACSVREEEEEDEGQSRVSEAVLKIMLHVLQKMNQPDLANTLQTSKSQISNSSILAAHLWWALFVDSLISIVSVTWLCMQFALLFFYLILKGLVHPKMKILSLITHSHVVPNL